MNLTASKMTAPSTNTALMRKLKPVLRKPRSSRVSCQVLIGRVRCEQSAQDIAGGERGARGLNGRPGEPVAPHRDGRNQFAVAHPGDRAVNRGAARLVGKQPRDFGIGEGLNESHGDRCRPDDPGQLADGRRHRADGKQDQGRHAAGNPEGARPVDSALEARVLRAGIGAGRFCCRRHVMRCAQNSTRLRRPRPLMFKARHLKQFA